VTGATAMAPDTGAAAAVVAVNGAAGAGAVAPGAMTPAADVIGAAVAA
jgi:hypothetical protein